MNIRVRVIKSIEEKLPKIRWWPWRNVRKEIKIEYINIIDRHIFTVFSTDNMEFYLPLRIVDENPGLPEDRVFSYNDKLLIEAEFYPDYLEALNGNEDIVREELKPIIGKPVSASPLSLETTNIVSKLLLDNRDAVVVKSYRLLPKVEMEPLMFKKLALENYKHIPVLHYLYRASVMSKPVVLLEEVIPFKPYTRQNSVYKAIKAYTAKHRFIHRTPLHKKRQVGMSLIHHLHVSTNT